MAKKGLRKGAVLIIVLAVLAVLSLLGTTFAVLNSVERTVSRSYLDEVRAKTLARSGVAAGVAVLQSEPFSPTTKYWGNDENENGVRDPNENIDGASTVHEVPLDWAKNPSLAVERDGNPLINPGDTVRIPIRGHDGIIRSPGISGKHDGASYANGADIYQLRVTDLSGRIFLNDGMSLFGANNSSVSQNLKRMLDVLGRLKSVRIQKLGEKVLAFRPNRGYNSMEDLGRFLTLEERKRLEPFVTCHAWVDKNVVNPVPLSDQVKHLYPVQYYRGDGIFRRGHGRNSQNVRVRGQLSWNDDMNTDPHHNAIWALDELSPSYIEVVHRAPVNVNAAPREVLITLLSDVCGVFISERRSFAPYSPSPASAPQGSASIPQKYYSWWTVKSDFGPGSQDADEYGYLYKTFPLQAPQGDADEMGTVSAGSTGSAALLADHMIACRDRRDLAGMPYKTAEWAGPFKSWAQFQRFMYAMVDLGLLKDPRHIYYDYVPSGDWSKMNATPSAGARKFASLALADALIANFNPNCTLNETNPDHNIYLRVDKTDLVVNSTEFTFMPTGVFQVESLGRVLEAEKGSGTLDMAVHRIVAEKRIIAEVKVYDMYRESTQRHFYSGRVCDKANSTPTNSSTGLEYGPEPDNGLNLYGDYYGGYMSSTTPELDGYQGYKPDEKKRQTGWGYEYSGYLQLTTYGGDGTKRTKGLKQNTQAGAPHWPTLDADKVGAGNHEGIHGHFQYDFDLHYNRNGERKEFASHDVGGSNEQVKNFPDADGDGPGPYGPLTGSEGAHRLCRSFRVGSNGGASSVMPGFKKYAPGDLRTDGFYSERHSGVAYSMTDDINFKLHGGVMGMWFKPSFFPEHTGKMRTLFSMAKRYDGSEYRNMMPNTLNFVPAHDMPTYTPCNACEVGSWGGGDQYEGPMQAKKCAYRDPFNPMYDGNMPNASQKVPVENRAGAFGIWQMRPCSLMGFRAVTTGDGGVAMDSLTMIDMENYAVTSSLNHNMHDHGLDTGGRPNTSIAKNANRPNYLEAHHWTHVQMSWQVLPEW